MTSFQAANAPKSMNFRFDINGIRAIAVVAVMLYHFDVPYFRGGFVGVDIFFVISGFLMTKIIVSGLSNNALSVVDFYWARFTRIYPALFFLCATVITLGWAFIDPLAYSLMGVEGATALAFVSNLYFFTTGGYFSGASENIWFLHTWSLSLEWQFYILYPLLLIFAQRLKVSILATLFVVTVVSFLISAIGPLFGGGKLASLLFYMIPSRAWEMTAGGLVAIASSQGIGGRRPHWMELAGLGLLLSAIFFFDSKMLWPGYAALVPVAGTMLIIASDRRKKSLLSSMVVQYLGSRSYSIYLWHWPIIVYIRYLDQFTWPVVVGGMILTIVMGEVSYRFVEGPVRGILQSAPRAKAAALSMVPVLLLLGTAIGVYANSGVISRAPKEARAVIEGTFTVQKDWRFPATCSPSRDSVALCRAGPAGEARHLVIGDSHAQMWFPAFDQVASQKGTPVDFASMAGCPPIVGMGKDGLPKCEGFNRQVLALAASGKYQTVYYIAHWVELLRVPKNPNRQCIELDGECRAVKDEADLNQVVSRLTKAVREISESSQVVIFAPTPSVDFDLPSYAARTAFNGTLSATLTRVPIDFMYQKIADVTAILRPLAGNKVVLFDPIPQICSGGVCDFVSSDGRVMLRDSNHLGGSFVSQLRPPLE